MRRRLTVRTLAAAFAVIFAAAPADAQRVTTRFDDEPEGEDLVVEIAKWSSGALALGAGAWAFAMQHDAEDRYAELERFCSADPTTCADVDGDGKYRDAALESRYQGIREDFRNARWLLIGAQALAVTSVVLFIVDLPRTSTPDNVPYEPPAFRVAPRADGAIEASFRYPVSNILTRSP